MTTKTSHKKIETDAKRPDQVLKSLTTGFQWSRQHSQLVLGAIIAFFLIGGGVSVFDYLSKQKEANLQEKYYSIERTILEKKREFAEKNKPAVQDKTKKIKETQTAAPAKVAEDFEKDYAASEAQLEQLVKQNPQSKAGLMAGLQATEILSQFNKQQQALDLLNQLNGKPTELLTALVLKQKGNLQANLGQCQQAISTWDQVIKSQTFEFLHTDLKLRQALCYETIKDLSKAEKLYQELAQKTGEDQDSVTSKEAEKYLRLLKNKKGI